MRHRADLVTAAYTAYCPVVAEIRCLHQLYHDITAASPAYSLVMAGILHQLHHHETFHFLHVQQPLHEYTFIASHWQAIQRLLLPSYTADSWVSFTRHNTLTLLLSSTSAGVLSHMEEFGFRVACEPSKSRGTSSTSLTIVRFLPNTYTCWSVSIYVYIFSYPFSNSSVYTHLRPLCSAVKRALPYH